MYRRTPKGRRSWGLLLGRKTTRKRRNVKQARSERAHSCAPGAGPNAKKRQETGLSEMSVKFDVRTGKNPFEPDWASEKPAMAPQGPLIIWLASLIRTNYLNIVITLPCLGKSSGTPVAGSGNSLHVLLACAAQTRSGFQTKLCYKSPCMLGSYVHDATCGGRPSSLGDSTLLKLYNATRVTVLLRIN